MRQAIFLLSLGLTFTFVFSGYSEEDDHDHDGHVHDHERKYPVIIPNAGSFVKVHNAVNTEIGSQPPPPSQGPQWGGPSVKNKGNDFEVASPRPQAGYSSRETEISSHASGQTSGQRVGVSLGSLTGLPRIQKYGYPPKCLDVYDKYDIDIEQTNCYYMVVITFKSEFGGYKGRHVTRYAHFKMSRRMEKQYGFVAVGLSKDDKMNDDHIVECVKPKNSVHPRMYHSWSNYHSMPTRLRDNSDIIINKTENFDTKSNILTCEFTRPMITTVEYVKDDGFAQKQVFDMTKEKYYILMAVGETAKPNSDILGNHGPRQEPGSPISIFDPPYYFYRSSSSGQSEELLTVFITLAFGYLIL